MHKLVIKTICLLFYFEIISANSTNQKIDTFPCIEENLPHYSAFRIDRKLNIDGKLNEEEWRDAERSPTFRDLVSGQHVPLDTRAAVLWDHENLYVAYWVEEPHIAATFTERDALLYKENDVELFIAGKNAYYELEINAIATIYEVFFIWQDAYELAGFDKLAEFGMGVPGYRLFPGVGFKEHPRGKRLGFWNWDLPGIKVATNMDGTLNDPADVDKGWTVEIAIPWPGLSKLFIGDNRSLPPSDGTVWRMDFSRFNQDKSGDDSGGWAWSPHYVWDSHVPECFVYVHFTPQLLLPGK